MKVKLLQMQGGPLTSVGSTLKSEGMVFIIESLRAEAVFKMIESAEVSLSKPSQFIIKPEIGDRALALMNESAKLSLLAEHLEKLVKGESLLYHKVEVI